MFTLITMSEEEILETRLKKIEAIHSKTGSVIEWGINSLPENKGLFFHDNNLKARIQLMHLDNYIDIFKRSLVHLARQEYEINKNNFYSDKIDILPPPLSNSYSVIGNFIVYASNVEAGRMDKLARKNPSLFKYINYSICYKGANELIGSERAIAENGGQINPGSMRNTITYRLHGLHINAFNHLNQRYNEHMSDIYNIIELTFSKEGKLLRGPWKYST
ncbi:MAG: hypothetical protein ACOCVN_03070 [bacterium]